MSFIEEVFNLRAKYCGTYQINKTEFLAAYNRERRLSEDYNGRQILELLQNADDAYASKVRIYLNDKENTLKIANTGFNKNSFSAAGVESLMIADYSSKSKWNSIGNKGLGFRSLISWCDCIKIKSNGYCLIFSKDIAHQFLLSNKNEPSDINSGLGYTQEEIEEINAEEEYEEGTVCFPILGIPKIEEQNEFKCIEDEEEEHWITEIELRYKNDVEIKSAIDFQLSEKGLDNNVLLFLKNIKEIIIENDKGIIRSIKSEILESLDISGQSYLVKEINGSKWKILSDEGDYPKEAFGNIKKLKTIPKYSSMIAWKDTNIHSYNLYTYFPTLIKLDLPFIIHGSFKIESARNHLIQENSGFKNNEYIFDKIINLIKIAVSIIQNESTDANWDSYDFLQSGNLSQESEYFNKKYVELINTLKVYPSVKNNYLSINDYKFYSGEWSSFALKQDYQDIFPDMLKPGRDLISKADYSDFYTPNLLNNKIKQLISIFNYENKLEERLTFISILKDFDLSKKYTNWNGNEKYGLLYSGFDIENHAISIENNETAFVYTEDSYSEVGKYKPDYVKFSLVEHELNKKLYQYLNIDEERKKAQNPDEPIQRTLARILSNFIKVQGYDITAITKDVISQTKQEIEKMPSKTDSIIQQEVRFLYFANTSWRKDKKKPDYKAYFLDKNHKAKLATDLYFSKSYSELGQTVENLFKEVNKNDDYLVDRSFWTILVNEEINNIIKFFSYFGVNSFITIDSFNSTELKDFQNRDRIADFNRVTGSNGNYYDSIYAILNIDKLNQITDLTTLLLIIYKSENLRLRLLNNNFEWYRSSSYMKTSYSFTCWQLQKLNKFNNSFASDKNSAIFRLLNREHPIRLEMFSEYDIPLSDIEKIMIALNAKNQLKDFGTDAIYNILASLKNELSDGKYVKSIYSEAKTALVELEKEKKIQTIPAGINYFVKEGKLSYYTDTDIYYFNDKILPKKVMDKTKILDMPLRQGGEVIPRLFNIKGRDDFKIDIFEPSDSPFNLKFQERFNELKPYLFALRFKSSVKDKDSEIKALNETKIILVSELKYKCPTISEDELELDFFDFVTDLKSNNFYIKIPEDESFFIAPQFQDSLTEIISIIFNLTDESKLNDFRLVISRINGLNSLTENGFLLDEEIDESLKYCNLQYTFEYGFWNYIYTIVTKEEIIPEINWKTPGEITSFVTDKLNIEAPLFDLKDFCSITGIKYLKMLNKIFNIDITLLLKANRISLQNYNIKLLRDIQSKYEKQFIKNWWDECYIDKNKQKDYFTRIFLYRDLIDSLLKSNEFELLEKLKYSLDFDAEKLLIDLVLRYTKGEGWNQIVINPLSNEYSEITELEEYKEYLYLKNNQNRYLFYFPGNLGALKLAETASNDDSDKDSSMKSIKPIAEWGNGSKPHSNDGRNKGGRGHGSHNDSASEKSKIIGTTAEEIVIKFFNDNDYSFIDRRGESGESNSDDSFHYDFEYWKGDETHRYLEVKHDGEIYMSIGEKEFGLNFQNKHFYDVALVDIATQKIKFINSFFEFDEDTENFENNTKFKAIPVKYKIETHFIKKD